MDYSNLALISGAILVISGTIFAVFLGISSERIEAQRPH
jgi:hypothetical protein